MRRLLVLSDLSVGADPSIDKAAVSAAIAMAEANIGLVCHRETAGRAGLIHKVAETVLGHGGYVASAPISLSPAQCTVDDSHELLAASTRHQWKLLVSRMSNGLLVLPGGVGTLEILMEYLTWIQRVRQGVPVHIVNWAGFWSPLIEMFERMAEKAFLPVRFGNRYTLTDDIPNPKEILLDDGADRESSSDGGKGTATTSVAKVEPRQVCVYCGSTPGSDPIYGEAAGRLGRAIAAAGLGLVYGGGGNGLMGILARAAMSNGGKVTGIMPRSLVDAEIPFYGTTRYYEVDSYYERKRHMCNLSDSFIVLPGGPGTLEEVAEQLAWAELDYHRKPILIVNVGGYWDPLLALLEQMRNRVPGTMDYRSRCVVVESPEQAVDVVAGLSRFS